MFKHSLFLALYLMPIISLAGPHGGCPMRGDCPDIGENLLGIFILFVAPLTLGLVLHGIDKLRNK